MLYLGSNIKTSNQTKNICQQSSNDQQTNHEFKIRIFICINDQQIAKKIYANQFPSYLNYREFI